jgi:hypothetical protein
VADGLVVSRLSCVVLVVKLGLGRTVQAVHTNNSGNGRNASVSLVSLHCEMN